MKLTLKQLRLAGKEINELFNNEAIDLTLGAEEITQLLEEALTYVDMNVDAAEFSETGLLVLNEIQSKSKKPTETITSKKPDNVDSLEEETEEDSTINVPVEEPVGETAEEEEGEVEIELPPIEEQIKSAKKKELLVSIAYANPEFKKFVKSIDKFKTLGVLKQAMLDILIELSPEKEEKPEPTKKELKAKEKKAITTERPPSKVEKVEKVKKEKGDVVVMPKKEGARVTKKSVIEEMLAQENGATIEEMAQAIVDRGIDPDYPKNCNVTKLWLNRMGYDTKKAVIAATPRFKS